MASSDQRLSTAELLYRCASQMKLQPFWLKNDGLFAITIAGKERLINFARSPLNSEVSSSIAKDKYLTRLMLERYGLPNIPFALPQTQAEARAFLELHGKIVAKPIKGSGLRDIHIVTDSSQLEGLAIDSYILEKYILGKEMRYLVLNGSVIGVYESEYGRSVHEFRNLECFSYPMADWEPALIDVAWRASQAIGLAFAAVDYLVDEDDNAYILEVNSMPDLKWFHAPSSGPPVDVARFFLESVIEVHEREYSLSPIASRARYQGVGS